MRDRHFSWIAILVTECAIDRDEFSSIIYSDTTHWCASKDPSAGFRFPGWGKHIHVSVRRFSIEHILTSDGFCRVKADFLVGNRIHGTCWLATVPSERHCV